MRGRLARSIVVLVVTGVGLAVALASPASAAITVTPPGQVQVKPGTVIIVKAQTPESFVCETGWSTQIAGKRSVVTSLSVASCVGGMATWRVKVSQVKRGAAFISLKRPKQSTTNANGCDTSSGLLCTAVGYS